MMNRSIFLLCITCLFFYCPSTHAETEQRYFTLLPDVPMVQGMEEIDSLNVIFDKAEGRVVETGGFIPLLSQKSFVMTPKAIEKFYADGLPQLGWKALKPMVFTRNAEQLIVIIEQMPKGMRVKMRLSPLSR